MVFVRDSAGPFGAVPCRFTGGFWSSVCAESGVLESTWSGRAVVKPSSSPRAQKTYFLLARQAGFREDAPGRRQAPSSMLSRGVHCWHETLHVRDPMRNAAGLPN